MHPNRNCCFQKIFLLFAFFLATNFLHAADYYWVNGSGNWSDYANHWATSSGGSTMHPGPPNYTDDVYFDANSFTAPGQYVQLDSTPWFAVRDMDWSGVQYQPEFRLSGTLRIHGDLKLSPDMDLYFTSQSQSHISFLGDGISVRHFDPAGQVLGTPQNQAIIEFQTLAELEGDLRLARNPQFPGSQVAVVGGYLYSRGYDIEADILRIAGYYYYIPGSVGGYHALLEPEGSSIDVDQLQFGCETEPNTNVEYRGYLGDSVHLRVRRILVCGYHESYSIGEVEFFGLDPGVYDDTSIPNSGIEVHFTGPVRIDSSQIFKAEWPIICMQDFSFQQAGGSLSFRGENEFKGEVDIASESANRTRISHSFTWDTPQLSKDSGEVCLNAVDIESVNAAGNATWKAVNQSVVTGSTGWVELPNQLCGQVNAAAVSSAEVLLEVARQAGNQSAVVRIAGQPRSSYQLYLVSMDGKQRLVNSSSRNEWQVSFAGEPSGIYFLQLKEGDQTVAVQKYPHF